MATTIQAIGRILTEADLRYQTLLDDNRIITGMGGLEHYRDRDGDPHLQIVIELSEEGRYVKVFSPMAYRIPADKFGLFLQACAMIQWRTKLIQFEFDDTDGEIRPIVEFPLEDAELTPRQFLRAFGGLIQIVDHFHPVLQRVLTEGVLRFENDDIDPLMRRMLGSLPVELLEQALEEARRRASRSSEPEED